MNTMLLKFLTATPTDKLFGGGVSSAPFSSGTIGQNFSTIFGFLINMVIIIAAFFVLVYLLWGVFDYISAGGESEKLKKAQSKMTTAVVGMILLIAVLMIWFLIVRDILGIVRGTGGNFEINIPSLRDQIEEPEPTPDRSRRPTIPFE